MVLTVLRMPFGSARHFQAPPNGRRGVACGAAAPESQQSRLWPCLWLAAILLLSAAALYATRRVLLGGAAVVVSGAAPRLAQAAKEGDQRVGAVRHSEEEWRKLLTPEQYAVLRQAATERPFSSPLNSVKATGTFICAACASPLFSSDAKYDSGTGWPSFFQPLEGAVDEAPDNSIFFMPRTEIRCKTCQGHLGHSFNDGPKPTGMRYCMNGLAMKFVPAEA